MRGKKRKKSEQPGRDVRDHEHSNLVDSEVLCYLQYLAQPKVQRSLCVFGGLMEIDPDPRHDDGHLIMLRSRKTTEPNKNVYTCI